MDFRPALVPPETLAATSYCRSISSFAAECKPRPCPWINARRVADAGLTPSCFGNGAQKPPLRFTKPCRASTRVQVGNSTLKPKRTPTKNSLHLHGQVLGHEPLQTEASGVHATEGGRHGGRILYGVRVIQPQVQ